MSTKIEETLAHQEQQISELSEIVTRQWEEIELLKKQLARFKDKIEGLEDEINAGSGEKGMSVTEIAARNKPPHY